MKTKIKLATLFTALFCILFITAAPGIKDSLRFYNNRRIFNETIKACEEYAVSKTRSSVIYYTKADSEYVNVVQRIISTYYPLLKKDINAQFDEAATVIIFPSKTEMYKAIGYPSHKAATAMGAYTAGIIAVLSPSAWLLSGESFQIDTFIKNGPVIHELVHFIIDKKTGGNYKEWFSEGAALYYENKYTGYTWERGTNTGRVTFKELSDSFKYIDEKESYGKSFEIVKYIAAAKGERALIYIFDGLENNKKLNELLNEVVNKNNKSGINAFDRM